MGFSPNTRGRAWIGTIQIANMEKAGLDKETYENPEKLAEYFIKLWEDSGAERKMGVAVCVSANGLYHCHFAAYGNTTTLKKVSDILFQSHVEPQLGGKKQLLNYLKKEGEFEEKGEQVLYTVGMDVVSERQGARSDLEEIDNLLSEGFTPREIFEEDFRYRKYEKMIRAEYLQRRLKEVPLIKENMQVIYITGESGSGKSYTYFKLCEEFGEDQIYLVNDFQNGGMDFYSGEKILFMDEIRTMSYSVFLAIIDKYSRYQIHSRYANTYALWDTVYICSILSPEEVYNNMVPFEDRRRDGIEQMLRRITEIQYKHKDNNGEFQTYSIPASEYVSIDNLRRRMQGLSLTPFTFDKTITPIPLVEQAKFMTITPTNSTLRR